MFQQHPSAITITLVVPLSESRINGIDYTCSHQVWHNRLVVHLCACYHELKTPAVLIIKNSVGGDSSKSLGLFVDPYFFEVLTIDHRLPKLMACQTERLTKGDKNLCSGKIKTHAKQRVGKPASKRQHPYSPNKALPCVYGLSAHHAGPMLLTI